MPVLNTLRTTKKLVLPSSTPEDEAWVEIYEELIGYDVVGLSEGGKSITKTTIVAISNLIHDWNFTDKEGKKVEINPETVKFLKPEDIYHIIEQAKLGEQYEAMADAKKKTLSSSSQPKPTTKTTSPTHQSS